MTDLTVRRDASGKMWLVGDWNLMNEVSVHSDKGMMDILKVLQDAAAEINKLSPGSPIGRAVEDIQAIITARMDETERSTDDEIEKAMSRPQSWFREPPGTYTADIAQARQIRRAADYVRSRPVTHIDQDRFRADLNRAAGGWFE